MNTLLYYVYHNKLGDEGKAPDLCASMAKVRGAARYVPIPVVAS